MKNQFDKYDLDKIKGTRRRIVSIAYTYEGTSERVVQQAILQPGKFARFQEFLKAFKDVVELEVTKDHRAAKQQSENKKPVCQCGRYAEFLDGDGVDICSRCKTGLLEETVKKLQEEIADLKTELEFVYCSKCEKMVPRSETVGWTDCGCGAGFDAGIVFDPFMGSGTTAVVAYENNRHYLGCELNAEYIDLGRVEKAKSKYALFESV